MANTINSLTIGERTGVFSLPYGVCSTAAGTAAKTVTVDNFALETGAMVVVKFSNANSAATPTLNVNSTGAKQIYRYGTTAASTSVSSSGWRAGAVQVFIYDGTGWVRDFWENTTYANYSLGQGYGTCATAAATAAKVVTLSNYSLSTGGVVAVKFTYAVPASATMNINSKGAKNIYYRGAKIVANVIKAGDIATFIYDGTQYHLLSIDRWQQDIDAKQATITGAATTITGSNLTASRALVSDSSGKVAVSAVTSTELGYLDGVTSAVQTQLDGKQATISGGASTITSSNLTANRALISNGSGKVAVSAVTSTELGYLDGVTSAVQTQINTLKSGKADKTHSHGYTLGNEVRFDGSALAILDVSYVPGLWAVRMSANDHDYPVHSLMYVPVPVEGKTLRAGFFGLNDSHKPAFFEFSVIGGYSNGSLMQVELAYEGDGEGSCGEVWIAPLIPN